MSDATMPGQTIRASEAAHFGRLAADWWNPAGSSATLHRLNPVRLRFIRDQIERHWGLAPDERRPLAGKRALDVGCGAGLLAEPLARLGADVTGIDAAPENIAVAAAHAAGTGLPIHYRAGELAALEAEPFDLVTCLEVVEHVADKPRFVRALVRHLAPDGLLILSTPNRTLTSRAVLVGAAEAIGAVPRGTHTWSDFVTPAEIEGLLVAAGLEITHRRGIAFSPTRGLHLSADERLNFILAARRA